jgi:pimeloyl-ACP methyl ester carboxylesterase
MGVLERLFAWRTTADREPAGDAGSSALPHDEAGTGPALVLLHAGVADRTMWAEQLEPLAAAGFRAVALDLPGFGDAPVAPGEQAPWADVLHAMDELSIARATLVGVSFGGAVALRVAVAAPARVAALVLVSAPAPGLAPSAELEAAWQAEEAALHRGDLDAAADAVVAAWTLPDAPDTLRDRIRVMQRRALALQAANTAGEAPDPVDRDPAVIATLDMPALVAAGERDKRDFIEGARQLANALPRARHAVIPGAGHLAPLETPDAFRALLMEFLRE